MKYIKKNNEPVSLKNYCSTPNAFFEGCNKKEIRKSLIKEQGAICAYCMQRISEEWIEELSKFKTEIEHYKAQKFYPDLRLTYLNMLGVVNGNAGNGKHKFHCDKSKANSSLTINPLNKNCETLIKFRANGKVYSDDKQINSEIKDILNLNEDSLVKQRREAIIFAIQSINKIQKKKKGESWSTSIIEKEKQKWEERYEKGYRPFCQAVIQYLDKKLNRSKNTF